MDVQDSGGLDITSWRERYEASAIPASERPAGWCALLLVKHAPEQDAEKDHEFCAKGVRKSKAKDAAAILRDASRSRLISERMQQRVAFVMMQLCEKHDCSYTSGLDELVAPLMVGLAGSKLAVQLKCTEVVVSQLTMGLYGSQSELHLFWCGCMAMH